MPILPSQRLMFNPVDGSDLGVKVEYAEGGKPEYQEKNPRSQIEIDKSQSTCGAWESIPGCKSGMRATDDHYGIACIGDSNWLFLNRALNLSSKVSSAQATFM